MKIDQTHLNKLKAKATQEDSPYKEAVDRTVILFREDGRYDKIYSKWFNK